VFSYYLEPTLVFKPFSFSSTKHNKNSGGIGENLQSEVCSQDKKKRCLNRFLLGNYDSAWILKAESDNQKLTFVAPQLFPPGCRSEYHCLLLIIL